MIETYATRTETIVMRRVRTIRALNAVITLETLAVTAFAAALWGIGREVWVAHVFRNMPSLLDLPDVIRFYIAAFADTRAIVQLLTVVVLVTGLWFMVALAGFVSRYLRIVPRQLAR